MSNVPTTKASQVLIVDSRYEDYDCLLEPAASMELNLCFAPTGRTALRTARLLDVGLWLVHTRLPDMSGFDLLEMVRSAGRESTFFVIDDTYCLEHEQQATLLQAAQYLCKPVNTIWFLSLQMGGGAIRAGPTTDAL